MGGGGAALALADHPPAAVAPTPRTVGLLHRVVQDAATQRRLRARRVELDGAGEDLVETRKRRRTVDECRDRRTLLLVDTRRHVDEHEASHELRGVRGERERGQTSE